MGILTLFDSCGYIFGSAIFLAGLTSLGLCLWATFQSGSLRAVRIATAFSLSPVAAGICGALFGIAFMWYLGGLGGMKGDNWVSLSKVPLAGLLVAVPSLVWALTLVGLRRGRA